MSRAAGTNPRALGVSARKLGISPRQIGLNPREIEKIKAAEALRRAENIRTLAREIGR